MDKLKLEEVFSKAEAAFWEAVTEACPEIEFGDVTPGQDIVWGMQMREMISEWYDGNQQAPTISCDGCEEIQGLTNVRALFRDGTNGPAKYCAACLDIIKSGQSDTVESCVQVFTVNR